MSEISDAAISAAEETIITQTSTFIHWVKSLLTWENLFKVIGAVIILLAMWIIYKIILRSIKKVPLEKTNEHKQQIAVKFVKYIFYITVNSINGKFYFGVHRTNPQVFDGYIGCGIARQSQATLDIAVHRAVKKYGYDNFKRTTIKVFDTKEEAYEFEKLIVTPTLLKSKQCYNTTIGGIGGGNEIQKKTVYQFDLNGNFIRSYKSARDAAMAVSPDNQDTIRASIKNCCLGTSYSSCGFFWSYYKEFIKNQKSLFSIPSGSCAN